MRATGQLVVALALAVLCSASSSRGTPDGWATNVAEWDGGRDAGTERVLEFVRASFNAARKKCAVEDKFPLFPLLSGDQQAAAVAALNSTELAEVPMPQLLHAHRVVAQGAVWSLYLSFDGFKTFARVVEKLPSDATPARPTDEFAVHGRGMGVYELVHSNPAPCAVRPGKELLHQPREFLDLLARANLTWTPTNSPFFRGLDARDLDHCTGAKLPDLPYDDAARQEAAELRFRLGDAPVPETYDMRETYGFCKAMTPSEQGQCGSCWAFAISHMLSLRICLKSQGVVNEDLSEQDMLSCVAEGDVVSGCEGAVTGDALEAVASDSYRGIPPEACFPYQGGDSTPGGGLPVVTCSEGCNDAYHYFRVDAASVAKYVARTSSSPTPADLQQAAETMQREILAHGPVMASMVMFESFTLYRTGVYRPVTGEKPSGGGHALVLVGWGVEGTERYWIALNSWGRRWGEDGFVRVAMANPDLQLERWGLTTADPILPQRLLDSANPCANGGTPKADGTCTCVPPFGGPYCEDCKASCLNGGLRLEYGMDVSTFSGCTCSDDPYEIMISPDATPQMVSGCSRVEGLPHDMCVVQEDDCAAPGGWYDFCTPLPKLAAGTCECRCGAGFFGASCEFGMFVDPATTTVCMGDPIEFHVYSQAARAGDRVYVRSAEHLTLMDEAGVLATLPGGEHTVCDHGAEGDMTQCPHHVKVTFTAPTEPGDYVAQYAPFLGTNEFGMSLGSDYNFHTGSQQGRFTVRNCATGSKTFAGVEGEDATSTSCPDSVRHCVVSAWSDWGTCVAAGTKDAAADGAAAGLQSRTRTTLVPPTKCGNPCPHLEEERSCDPNADTDAAEEEQVPAEPVCNFGEWSTWSECTAPCGGGRRLRTRQLLAGSSGSCGPLEEQGTCNTAPCAPEVLPECPVPGAKRYTERGQACVPFSYLHVNFLSGNCTTLDNSGREWCYVDTSRNWGNCNPLRQSVTGEPCVFPFTWRGRTYQDCAASLPDAPSAEPMCATSVTSYVSDGAEARTTKKLSVCAKCRRDCQLGQWSEWTPCTATCGGGQQQRTREVAVRANEYGAQCSGATVEVRTCNTDACPPKCRYGSWSAWAPCDKLCGGGTRRRTRQLVEGDPEQCKEPLVERQACNTESCEIQVDDDALATCPAVGSKRVTVDGRPCATFSDGVETLRGQCSVRPFCSAQTGQCDGGGREWCMVSASERAFCAPLRNTTHGAPCILPFKFEGETYHDCVPTEVDGHQVDACAVQTDGDRNVVHAAVCQPCRRDCQVSEWDTEECTASCGGGVVRRVRSVLAQPTHGGKTCPVLEEELPCNTQPCAVDCAWSEWGPWSDCSLPCATGEQVRARTVERPAQHGGRACEGAATERRTCNTHACDASAGGAAAGTDACKFGNWTDWSPCSSQCGGGVHVRFRALLKGTEAMCGPVAQVERCNEVQCADGAEALPACPDRTKPRVTQDGKPCVAATYHGVHKGAHECFAVGAHTYEWCFTDETTQAWGRCEPERTTQDGQACILPFEHGGHQYADCATSSSHGLVCPVSVNATYVRSSSGSVREARPAVSWGLCRQCSESCQLSEWTDWSPCTATCGGEQFRIRAVTRSATAGGDGCEGPFVESRRCDDGCAPPEPDVVIVEEKAEAEAGSEEADGGAALQRCVYGSWSSWSNCSAACGEGTQGRTRVLERGAPDECTEPLLEQRRCEAEAACEEAAPAQDCEVSEWGEWSECSAECGTGESVRTRTIVSPSANGGRSCGDLVQTKACNTAPCKDCVLSAWSSWSLCNVSCGAGGMQHRQRSVEQHPTGSGAPCEGAMRESRACNTEPCPKDCVATEWGAWSVCSKTCGGGEQSRRRDVAEPAEAGGAPCASLVETRRCNTAACPVDCELSDWTEWGECSATCGGGVQSRLRAVVVAPAHNGTACGALSQERECNTAACPVDCVMGEWSAWGNCSAECGGGEQARTREVEREPRHGGLACSSVLNETRACNQLPCPNKPRDCVVSDWGPMGECSAECGGGVQARSRRVLAYMEDGGKPCPHLREEVECNTQPCGCKVADTWGEWSECSAECGGGTRRRVLKVLRQPDEGGQACGATVETEACNTQACPVDCVLGGWGTWSACSAECGGGVEARERPVVQAAQHGGRDCDASQQVETRKCNTRACDACEFTAWSAWSACSVECGGGVRFRMRNVTFEGRDAKCGPLVETQACNERACAAEEVEEELPACPSFGATRATVGGFSCAASSYGGRNYSASECIVLGTDGRREWCFVEKDPSNPSAQTWDWCLPQRASASQSMPNCILPFTYGGRVYTDCYTYTKEGQQMEGCAVRVNAQREGLDFAVCKPCRKAPGQTKEEAERAEREAEAAAKREAEETAAREAAEEEAAKKRARICPSQRDSDTPRLTQRGLRCRAAAFQGAKFEASECITRNANGSVEWCFVEADDAHPGVQWDWCVPLRRSTSAARPHCIFPFHVGGKTYTDCYQFTRNGQQQEGCATQVDPVTREGVRYDVCQPCEAEATEEQREVEAKKTEAKQLEEKGAGEADLDVCPPEEPVVRVTVGGHQCRASSYKGTDYPATQCITHDLNGTVEWCYVEPDPAKPTLRWDYCKPLRRTISQLRPSCILPFHHSGRTYTKPYTFTRDGIQLEGCATQVDHATREAVAFDVCRPCRSAAELERIAREEKAEAEAAEAEAADEEAKEAAAADTGSSVVDMLAAILGLRTSMGSPMPPDASSSMAGATGVGGGAATAEPSVGTVGAQMLTDGELTSDLDSVQRATTKLRVGVEAAEERARREAAAAAEEARRVALSLVATGATGTSGDEDEGEAMERAMGVHIGSPDAAVAAAMGGATGATGATGAASAAAAAVVGATGLEMEAEGVSGSASSDGTVNVLESQAESTVLGEATRETASKTITALNEALRQAPQPSDLIRRLQAVAGLVREAESKMDRSKLAACPSLSAPRRTLNGQQCVAFMHGDQRVAASECALKAETGAEWCVTNRTTGAWDWCVPQRVTRKGRACVLPFVSGGVEYRECMATDLGLEVCATEVDPETRAMRSAGFCTPCAREQVPHVGDEEAEETARGEDGLTKSEREALELALRLHEEGGVPDAGAATREAEEAHKEEEHKLDPVDCELSDWSPWSRCSVECDGGVRVSTRHVLQEPRNGGKTCGALLKEEACGLTPCKEKCAYGEWSSWSECSKTCGTGSQKRRRSLLPVPSAGFCDAEQVEERACNQQACPVDCEMGPWGEWSACSQSCDGGAQERVREVVKAPTAGGRSCPPATESRPCNQKACDAVRVNCEVGEWSAWGKCSKACGRGTRSRTREVLVRPKLGGKECPTTLEEQVCNEQPCAVDCEVGEWGAWGNCSAPCGGGVQARTREVLTSAEHGGAACPVLRQVQECSMQACPPTPCTVSAWSAWSSCSAKCGGGMQMRWRHVVQMPMGAGAERCPELKQERVCNSAACGAGGEASETGDAVEAGADEVALGQDTHGDLWRLEQEGLLSEAELEALKGMPECERRMLQAVVGPPGSGRAEGPLAALLDPSSPLSVVGSGEHVSKELDAAHQSERVTVDAGEHKHQTELGKLMAADIAEVAVETEEGHEEDEVLRLIKQARAQGLAVDSLDMAEVREQAAEMGAPVLDVLRGELDELESHAEEVEEQMSAMAQDPMAAPPQPLGTGATGASEAGASEVGVAFGGDADVGMGEDMDTGMGAEEDAPDLRAVSDHLDSIDEQLEREREAREAARAAREAEKPTLQRPSPHDSTFDVDEQLLNPLLRELLAKLESLAGVFGEDLTQEGAKAIQHVLELTDEAQTTVEARASVDTDRKLGQELESDKYVQEHFEPAKPQATGWADAAPEDIDDGTETFDDKTEELGRELGLTEERRWRLEPLPLGQEQAKIEKLLWFDHGVPDVSNESPYSHPVATLDPVEPTAPGLMPETPETPSAPSAPAPAPAPAATGSSFATGSAFATGLSVDPAASLSEEELERQEVEAKASWEAHEVEQRVLSVVHPVIVNAEGASKAVPSGHREARAKHEEAAREAEAKLRREREEAAAKGKEREEEAAKAAEAEAEEEAAKEAERAAALRRAVQSLTGATGATGAAARSGWGVASSATVVLPGPLMGDETEGPLRREAVEAAVEELKMTLPAETETRRAAHPNMSPEWTHAGEEHSGRDLVSEASASEEEVEEAEDRLRNPFREEPAETGVAFGDAPAAEAAPAPAATGAARATGPAEEEVDTRTWFERVEDRVREVDPAVHRRTHAEEVEYRAQLAAEHGRALRLSQLQTALGSPHAFESSQHLASMLSACAARLGKEKDEKSLRAALEAQRRMALDSTQLRHLAKRRREVSQELDALREQSSEVNSALLGATAKIRALKQVREEEAHEFGRVRDEHVAMGEAASHILAMGASIKVRDVEQALAALAPLDVKQEEPVEDSAATEALKEATGTKEAIQKELQQLSAKEGDASSTELLLLQLPTGTERSEHAIVKRLRKLFEVLRISLRASLQAFEDHEQQRAEEFRADVAELSRKAEHLRTRRAGLETEVKSREVQLEDKQAKMAQVQKDHDKRWAVVQHALSQCVAE